MSKNEHTPPSTTKTHTCPVFCIQESKLRSPRQGYNYDIILLALKVINRHNSKTEGSFVLPGKTHGFHELTGVGD